MKIKFFTMILLCCCTTPWADTTQVSPLKNNTLQMVTRTQISGLWGMSIPENKKCIEYYNFKNNQDVFIKSAEEWSYGVYDYQGNIDQQNAAALTLNIRYDNKQKDCSGVQQDQSGDSFSVYIKWDNPSTIQFCHENNQACFATLKRILP